MQKKEKTSMFSRRSQITAFVVIALIIIAGIVGFFVVRNYISQNIPTSISPVYQYYIECIKQSVEDGTSLMGTQAGYITLPDFQAGTSYAPFSSQLGFMGFGVPYWYYISGNGIAKEQVPTKRQMEIQLADYVKEQASKCDFSQFTARGYNITLEDSAKSSADVSISDTKISVDLRQTISVNYGDSNFVATSHSTSISSGFGSLYNLAREIYNYEKTSMFLENYSVDALYTYAPVEGSLFNCSPAIWNPYEVIGELKNALNANLGAVRFSGDYYALKGATRGYFVAGKTSSIDVKNKQVSFLYSQDWPSRFEIWPTKNNMMIAESVGTQQGLGAMGFCYIPYKFSYDMYFPVLVQIYDARTNEIFQFPFAVVIDKNNPRKAQPSTFIDTPDSLCDKSSNDVYISTYNVNLEPVEAEVSFKCLNDECYLGKTETSNYTGYSSLITKVPACYNGVITASADGYKDTNYVISTNREGMADIILDREYNLKLEVYLDGSLTNDLSVLTITENFENQTIASDSIAYPYNRDMKIAEGNYNFDLKIYGSGTVNLPATSSRQCVETPQAGILGIFGFTDESCFDVNIPGQKITNVLAGGGNTNKYVTPSELENAQVIRIFARRAAVPTNIEDIQSNYDLIPLQKLDIQFA